MSLSITFPWKDTVTQAYWGEPHEGFVNAATWMFALYFGQERKNMEALEKLRRKDGEFNPARVVSLFWTAYLGQGGLQMEKLDDWVGEQVVHAGEVLSHLTTK